MNKKQIRAIEGTLGYGAELEATFRVKVDYTALEEEFGGGEGPQTSFIILLEDGYFHANDHGAEASYKEKSLVKLIDEIKEGLECDGVVIPPVKLIDIDIISGGEAYAG